MRLENVLKEYQPLIYVAIAEICTHMLLLNQRIPYYFILISLDGILFPRFIKYGKK